MQPVCFRTLIACEQALHWGLARDSWKQGLGPKPLTLQSTLGPLLVPESLVQDPNRELARRLVHLLYIGQKIC